MSLKTLTPDEVLPLPTEPGVYLFQLNQTLTGTETITITGGGQTFHTFDLDSVDDLSGITLNIALDTTTLTAANNVGDLEIGVERIQAL